MKMGMAGWLVLAVAAALLTATAQGQGFGGGLGVGPGFESHGTPMHQGFGPGAPQKGWWNSPRMVEQLKLTDEQRKAMDATMLEHRAKLIDLRAGLEKAELAMEPLMGADTLNDAGIKAQIDKVVQARGELERANARFLLAIREKLTADQWKQLRAQRDEPSRDWRPDGRGRGPGGPGQIGPGGQFRHPGPPPPQPPAPPAGAPEAGPGSGAPSGSGEQQ